MGTALQTETKKLTKTIKVLRKKSAPSPRVPTGMAPVSYRFIAASPKEVEMALTEYFSR